MKLKKIILIFCALALICSISVTVYAATADGSKNDKNVSSKPIMGFRSSRFSEEEESNLTDEQKTEMEAIRTEMQEEMKARLAQELTDGKITQEQYDEMIVAIENGEMHGMRGCRHGFNGERPELTDEQKAEMEAKRAEMQGNNNKPGFGKGETGGFERGRGMREMNEMGIDETQKI